MLDNELTQLKVENQWLVSNNKKTSGSEEKVEDMAKELQELKLELMNEKEKVAVFKQNNVRLAFQNTVHYAGHYAVEKNSHYAFHSETHLVCQYSIQYLCRSSVNHYVIMHVIM